MNKYRRKQERNRNKKRNKNTNSKRKTTPRHIKPIKLIKNVKKHPPQIIKKTSNTKNGWKNEKHTIRPSQKRRKK